MSFSPLRIPAILLGQALRDVKRRTLLRQGCREIAFVPKHFAHLTMAGGEAALPLRVDGVSVGQSPGDVELDAVFGSSTR
jgi:hypothetical protein